MPRSGRYTPEQAERMIASFRATLPPDKAEEQAAIVRLLTDRPVRANAAPQDDGGVDDAYSSLWPPVTRAEAERREREYLRRVAASAPVDDDDLYRAIFGEEPQQ